MEDCETGDRVKWTKNGEDQTGVIMVDPQEFSGEENDVVTERLGNKCLVTVDSEDGICPVVFIHKNMLTLID